MKLIKLFAGAFALLALMAGIVDGHYGKTDMPVARLGGPQYHPTYYPPGYGEQETNVPANAVGYQQSSAIIYAETRQSVVQINPMPLCFECGNWQARPNPSMPTIPVRFAKIQRQGIGENGIQLNYEAGLVNILVETAFTSAIGRVADDMPTTYNENRVVFETPDVMQAIWYQVYRSPAFSMQDLQKMGIQATACANFRGETLAVLVTGSGPTLEADNGQILDTQWTIIMDKNNQKWSFLFTRSGSEFWIVEPR